MSGPAVLASMSSLPRGAPQYAIDAEGDVAYRGVVGQACSALSRVRFHSTTSKPDAARRRAIAPPILPVPRIATVVITWPPAEGRSYVLRRPRSRRFGAARRN